MATSFLMNKYLLNRRFVFDPSLNTVLDKETGELTRLEPRLMEVMNRLTEKNESLTTREELIETIWANYGGADDALNLAISSLRKIIKDKDRRIIETIPRKGYALHAFVEEVKDHQNPKKAGEIFTKYRIAASFLCAFIAGAILWKLSHRNTGSDLMNTSTTMEVDYASLQRSPEQNELNTVITLGPGKTRFKLIARGDAMPEFYANGVLIPLEQRDRYTQLIDQMQRELWKRQGNVRPNKN